MIAGGLCFKTSRLLQVNHRAREIEEKEENKTKESMKER